MAINHMEPTGTGQACNGGVCLDIRTWRMAHVAEQNVNYICLKVMFFGDYLIIFWCIGF